MPRYAAIRAIFRGELLENEPLRRHTSLRVGGPANLFAIPQDIADLAELVQGLDAKRIPWFVIGGGFNLLVLDGGFRGAVISLEKLDRIELRQGALYAEAGVTNRTLTSFARDNGLGGVEFLAGIPGTLGGALAMNAGAHGAEIFDTIASVEILSNGRLERHEKKTLDYGYRSLQLEPDKIIINAVFELTSASRETIAVNIEECLQKRRETQQVGFPTAGSYFKNPPGLSAWRLIDEAGLRGLCVGGAQVSEIHCNFIVNRSGASAADFQGLAAIVKERVFAASGVWLEEEIRIVGRENAPEQE